MGNKQFYKQKCIPFLSLVCSLWMEKCEEKSDRKMLEFQIENRFISLPLRMSSAPPAK